MKFYVAYGSNLNKQQMAFRCPDAKIVVTGVIQNYRLEFRRVLTIIPCIGSSVPVAIWSISSQDERKLDVYEGYPTYYSKEIFNIQFGDGQYTKAMGYLMNAGCLAQPSTQYFKTVLQGYRDFSLDERYLREAFDRSQKNII